MSLAPNLFDRRFGDLMEIGRARLRSLAPAWTDHNAHDPGITLMELLAWVTEAQLYSLGRVRKDERAAYAALLGITNEGAQPAEGLIWPDWNDPTTPARTYVKSSVIAKGAAITLTDADAPVYRPTHTLLWAPGEIVELKTRLRSGKTIDHTAINKRGGLPFLPFGERPGGKAVLSMKFAPRDDADLFGKDRRQTKGALWPIGVMAAPPLSGSETDTERASCRQSPLAATLIADHNRYGVRIVHDSTHGLLKTGVLLLDLDAAPADLHEFSIELQAPDGLPRAPRLLRMEPNVLPMRQGRAVDGEVHTATGLPDWTIELNEPGLRFESGEEPVNVRISEPTGPHTWKRCDRLFEHGPSERVFELNAQEGSITFGNGINGLIPPSGSQTLVSYEVSDGAQGNVARNRKWKVAGFAGTFGINVDPVTGGADPTGWIDHRRQARKRARAEHALVSAGDIASAALAIPLIDVARAWVAEQDPRAPRTGVITLVAMRTRPPGPEPEQTPETPLWLETIRRRLAPRMPLGSRLSVVAPRYVDFSIEATVAASAGADPEVLKPKIDAALRKRLALTAARGQAAREPGDPVSPRDVAAWLRAVDGVAHVVHVQLRDAKRRILPQVPVAPDGLPRWMSSRSLITVIRPSGGAAR